MVFLNGVGTQMSIASMSASRPMSVVAFSSGLTTAATSARHVRNIASARVDLRRFPGIDIEAGDVEAGVRELDGQRQADVAEADHTNRARL